MSVKSISGQFVHETGTGFDGVSPAPAHHLKVELLRKGWFQHRLIAKTTTDRNGCFSFKLKGTKNKETFFLKLIEEPWHLKNQLPLSARRRTIKEIKISDIETGKKHQLGVLKIDFWEYQKEWPRLRVSEALPQKSFKGYKVERERACWNGGKAEAFIRPAIEDAASLNDIDLLFGKNLTFEKEEKHPGSTKDGHWLGMRILNGFNPAFLQKDDRENHFQLEYLWNKYRLDTSHELPNVRVTLKLDGGFLRITEVALQYRKNKEKNFSLGDWRIWKEEDEHFEDALLEFRIAYLVAGECDMHLARGHLNVEQYAMAAFRNLYGTPLAKLLFPHLRDVVLINSEGEDILFDENSILAKTSALKPEALKQRFKEVLGSCDWDGFHPRKPLSQEHHFAHAANLYWSILIDYVDGFFSVHCLEIEKSWDHLRAFSRDLVHNSYPFQPYLGNPHTIWQDTKELADPSKKRITYQGVLRAISPVILYEKANKKDLERLKACCCYAIFMATFWHTWCHDRQVEDAGQTTYAMFGRHRDYRAQIADAARQQYLVHVLLKSKFGLMLDNRTHDLPESFLKQLREASSEFQKYGFDIQRLRSFVHI